MAAKGSVKEFENLCGVDPLVRLFSELISYDTKSDPLTKNVPSSIGQLRLGAYLAARFTALGLDALQDEKGVVTVSLPASEGCENAVRLCLLAHLDTSPDAKGSDIKPMLVKNFDDDSIELENGLIIDSALCPELLNHKGDDIIVTDGTTLLGADDKAGVAVLTYLLHEIVSNPSLKHGPLKIVFSVDEEIGLSTEHLDVKALNCDYGVTVDGNDLGELDTETFNAAGATVHFKGRSVHTAVAYKKLVNAVGLAARFMALLPQDEKPENTREREGFYHVHAVEGETEQAKIRMILRDFERAGLDKRIATVRGIAAFINRECGYEAVTLEITEQYANMAGSLKEHPLIVKLCREAYEAAGIEVRECAVRGGTDGSNLSNRGLPCPNIFAGALNCHGPYECLPVGSLNKCFKTVAALVSKAAQTEREK